MTNNDQSKSEKLKEILRKLDAETSLHLNSSIALFIAEAGRFLGSLTKAWEIKVGDVLDALIDLDSEKKQGK